MSIHDIVQAPSLEHELTEYIERSNFCYLSKIVNGGIAGIVGVSCVFPLDLIKTRLQNQTAIVDGLQSKGYTGIIDCAKKTWTSAGPSLFSRFSAFYQGASVNVLLITPEKAIKLVANDFFRYQMTNPGEKKLGAFRGMVAGGLAGFGQIVVTTPMELLKINMQQSSNKQSVLQLIGRIVRARGLLGLYHGIGPTMVRDVSFSVIYFPLFAQLDSLGPRKKDGSGDAVFWTSFASGLCAGACASFLVTPFDVVKTRIQTSTSTNGKQYIGVLDALRQIVLKEGPRSLFKGAACRMMVMAPLFGIAQMVYYIGVAEKMGIGGGCDI